jgi:hypothetical protein
LRPEYDNESRGWTESLFVNPSRFVVICLGRQFNIPKTPASLLSKRTADRRDIADFSHSDPRISGDPWFFPPAILALFLLLFYCHLEYLNILSILIILIMFQDSQDTQDYQ